MKQTLLLSSMILSFTLFVSGNEPVKTSGAGKNTGPESVFLSQVQNSTPVSGEGGTKKLTKADFLKLVWNYEKSPKEWIFLGDKPALIDFYADWCGPCRIASPILEEVSREFAGKINIYKIDTQREQELAAVFGVSSIPVFLYIPKQGRPAMMAGIARSKEDTKKMFIDNINKFLLQPSK